MSNVVGPIAQKLMEAFSAPGHELGAGEAQAIEDAVVATCRPETKILKAVNDLFYVDAHQWSTRPCATCQAITQLIGEPFGCIRYAVERAKR